MLEQLKTKLSHIPAVAPVDCGLTCTTSWPPCWLPWVGEDALRFVCAREMTWEWLVGM